MANEIGYIYGLYNKINGKWYIGQTVQNPYLYIKTEYFYRKVSRRPKLSNAINKYGHDNFMICLLDSAKDMDELNAKEIQYIADYDSVKNGYNIEIGGRNAKRTPSTIRKWKKSIREYYKNNHGSRKGKTHSEETKEKIKIASIGRKNKWTDEGRKRWVEARKKYVVSESTREKLRNLHKGVPKTQEHKRKLSESKKGKRFKNHYSKFITLFNIENGDIYYGIAKDIASDNNFCYTMLVRDLKKKGRYKNIIKIGVIN